MSTASQIPGRRQEATIQLLIINKGAIIADGRVVGILYFNRLIDQNHMKETLIARGNL